MQSIARASPEPVPLCKLSPNPAQTQPHSRRNKTGTGSELRGACPAFVPKQRAATDQPAPNNGCGGDPQLIHSRMSKINCRRQVLISKIQASRAETARKSLRREW